MPELTTTPLRGHDEPPPAGGDNLYIKLYRVLSNLGAVPKRGRNEAWGYDFVTESDVLAATRVALLKERLLMIPSVEQWQADPVNGNFYVVLHTEIINIDNPSERHTVKMIGSGNDMTASGMRDKAAYKSLAGATKYTHLKVFMLPTGDDPEVARKEELEKGAAASKPPLPKFPPVANKPAPVANGSPTLAIGEEEIDQADIDAIRLLQQSAMTEAAQKEAPPPPPPEESPEIVWARGMRRAAEDARDATTVITLWNDNKEMFRRLAAVNKNEYNRLHETFVTRRDQLKARN